MNKQKILETINDADSAIEKIYDELEMAYNKSDHHISEDFTFTVFSLIEDIRALAEEEPIPTKVDKQILLKTIEMASAAMAEVTLAIDEKDYRLADTELFLLRFVLDDISELVNEVKGKDWGPPTRPPR